MSSTRLQPEDLAQFDALVPDFITITSDIKDPRDKSKITHSLTTILFVCLSGYMAGYKSINAFGKFATLSWPWIKESLGDEIGEDPTSHDTIGRVLQKLKPSIIEELLTQFSSIRTTLNNDSHIAIDGKRNLGTAENRRMNLAADAGGQQPYTTVSALAVGAGLVMAAHTSEEPGSEHDCVDIILKALDLRGAIVTMDAGNAYPKFAKSIVNEKGQYLLCIKGNNKRTNELCAQVFDSGVDRIYDMENQVVKSRKDEREVRVAILDKERESGHGTGECDRELMSHWPDLKCIIEVTRKRGTRTGQLNSNGDLAWSYHTVRFVCSKIITAKQAMKLVREHWHVENKLHWTLDVSYGEDASRARSGFIAQNLASIRRFANNMLASVTGRASNMTDQMKFSLDFEFRKKVLGFD